MVPVAILDAAALQVAVVGAISIYFGPKVRYIYIGIGVFLLRIRAITIVSLTALLASGALVLSWKQNCRVCSTSVIVF